jgi:membrane protease YdiL (CAAX protease family)
LYLSKKSYLFATLVIMTSSYSQYWVGGLGAILSFFIVYGIPLIITSMIFGSAINQRAFKNMYRALKFGLASFGGFTVLGTLASAAIFYMLLVLDPSAVNLLNRPNPVLNIPPGLAWIMIGVSFIVVGPAEEYIFRGFVYGGMLSLFKKRHWLSLAFVSSIIFAIVHLYYALVYSIASLVQFADLVTFGMAMAITYYLSDGNLFVPALIHGAYDATGFVGVAVSSDLGLFLRGLLVLTGIVVGLGLLLQNTLRRKDHTQNISV